MRNRTLVISAVITVQTLQCNAFADQDLKVGMARTPNTKPDIPGFEKMVNDRLAAAQQP